MSVGINVGERGEGREDGFLWSRKPLKQIAPGRVATSKVRQHVHADREQRERCSQVETPSVVTALRNIRVETELDSIVTRETMARMLDSCGGSRDRSYALSIPNYHIFKRPRTRNPNLRQCGSTATWKGRPAGLRGRGYRTPLESVA